MQPNICTTDGQPPDGITIGAPKPIKYCGRNKIWTNEDIQILKDIYKYTIYQEMANILDRTVMAIMHRSSELGLTQKRVETRIDNKKRCIGCKIFKNLSEFNKNKRSTIDGLTGYCKICNVERATKYVENNRRKTYNRLNKWNKDNRIKNYIKVRVNNAKRYCNITEESFINQIEKHNKRCAICTKGIFLKPGDNHIDHDHSTGEFRGILCRKCNIGIGHLQENHAILINAAKYLGLEFTGEFRANKKFFKPGNNVSDITL